VFVSHVAAEFERSCGYLENACWSLVVFHYSIGMELMTVSVFGDPGFDLGSGLLKVVLRQERNTFRCDMLVKTSYVRVCVS
jgi:hypothetical protein